MLVQRLAAGLDPLDAEHAFPVRLIADDFGKHELGLVPAPEIKQLGQSSRRSSSAPAPQRREAR
jgi:hypothetical protein